VAWSPGLVSFPPHAVLILEERLKEHQAQGLLPPTVDVTGMALKILSIVSCQGSAICPTDTLHASTWVALEVPPTTRHPGPQTSNAKPFRREGQDDQSV